MLKIWGRTNSVNVQKVMWTVAELGLAHERIDAGGRFGVVGEDGFRAMNPNGLVPVIDDDGVVLWESNAIVRYLCARYGDGTLWPAGAAARAQADKWMDWQVSVLAPPMTRVFLQLVRTPEAERDMAVVEAAAGSCAAALRIVDVCLGGAGYLAGEALTMADIPLGAVAHRWYALDLERPEMPNLRAWYGRLAQRPAYRTSVMLPLS